MIVVLWFYAFPFLLILFSSLIINFLFNTFKYSKKPLRLKVSVLLGTLLVYIFYILVDRTWVDPFGLSDISNSLTYIFFGIMLLSAYIIFRIFKYYKI